jgi:hypothetical protein
MATTKPKSTEPLQYNKALFKQHFYMKNDKDNSLGKDIERIVELRPRVFEPFFSVLVVDPSLVIISEDFVGCIILQFNVIELNK